MKYFIRLKLFALILLCASLAVILKQPNSAKELASLKSPTSNLFESDNDEGTTGNTLFIGDPVMPTVSQAARDIGETEAALELDREVNPRLTFTNVEARAVNEEPSMPANTRTLRSTTSTSFTTPIINQEGQPHSYATTADAIGDIGPNHFVQMINKAGSTALVLDKLGNELGSFNIRSLGSGNCTSGTGDPSVVHDRFADRWVMSEFVPRAISNSLCMYVSQTADPLGAYWAYEFIFPSFPDYPKLAVWSNAYFATANEVGGGAVYAFDRANMILGNAVVPLRFQADDLSGFGGFQTLTVADHDGSAAPPSDASGIFMRHFDSEAHGILAEVDYLEIWEFQVDWNEPRSATFSQLPSVPISEFDSDICGLTTYSCIPQPSGENALDPMREVIMHRLQYRNDVGHETLVGTFVTDSNNTDVTGMHWFELRKIEGLWSLHQDGTYAPDGDSRFMGAISMDKDGNIALAYNVSSATVYPSLRYTGREHDAVLGTMNQTETTIVAGSGSNDTNRYGDFSSMGVDPSDDCTFWFTGMYNPSSQWSTQIASFRFPECGQTPPSTSTPTATSTSTPTATATNTATATPIPTNTATPIPTTTATSTTTVTATSMATSTATATVTNTTTSTSTVTATSMATSTATATNTATATTTATSTATSTSTATPTNTNTATVTPTHTPKITPTATRILTTPSDWAIYLPIVVK